jgi:hypothetical protein
MMMAAASSIVAAAPWHGRALAGRTRHRPRRTAGGPGAASRARTTPAAAGRPGTAAATAARLSLQILWQAGHDDGQSERRDG